MHNNNFYNLIICCLRVIVGQTLRNVISGESDRKCLILLVTSRKALLGELSMAESEELSYYTESDSDSYLSGSVTYSTDSSDDDGVSDTSVSPESEVAPYRFEPEYVDSESRDLRGEVDPVESDSLSPERVGNTDW